MSRELLPVHGFVLAGGRSSRMGRDKALLEFGGRPMVQIALEKLRAFCAEVSIAGNREDLGVMAPVVLETRLDIGPAAGIEAGLRSAAQPWAMFVPVDVPLVPAGLLRRWATHCVEKGRHGLRASYLRAGEQVQPGFCMLRHECLPVLEHDLDQGERRLLALLAAMQELDPDALESCEAAGFAPGPDLPAAMVERWFSNVNTPQELAAAETWVRAEGYA